MKWLVLLGLICSTGWADNLPKFKNGEVVHPVNGTREDPNFVRWSFNGCVTGKATDVEQAGETYRYTVVSYVCKYSRANNIYYFYEYELGKW